MARKMEVKPRGDVIRKQWIPNEKGPDERSPNEKERDERSPNEKNPGEKGRGEKGHDEKGQEPVDIKQVAAAGAVRTSGAEPPPGAVAQVPIDEKAPEPPLDDGSAR